MFCPDRKGFFPALYLQLLENITVEERDKFDKFDSKEERINFMYDHRFPKVGLFI